MGKRHEQTLLKRRYRSSQQAYEKMLNITNYQRNSNKKKWDTISYQSEWLLLKSQKITDAGEAAEKREHWYTVGGSVHGSTIVESSMVTSQRAKNRTAIWPSNPITGNILRGTEVIL